MATTISYELIQDALRGSASAFRRRTVLHPAGGDGDKVFPPTYVEGPYATETRVINGIMTPTVVLDSVQSQANRMELALLRAVRYGTIEMPLWQVDFRGTEVKDVGIISALEAPHRLSDAIFRDSFLDGKKFPDTPQGEAIESSSSQNSTALLETCPTALLFGMWHSTGNRGGRGAKFPRAIASEIIGIDYSTGLKKAIRIDPLNISSSAEIFVKEKDVNNWQFETGGKEFKQQKPSNVNHGNVPNNKVDAAKGGVTMREAMQILVLSLPAIRRLSFPFSGSTNEAANLAAQSLLVALGLVAAELAQSVGFDLRSRCLLDGPAGAWELLDRGKSTVADGTLEQSLEAYSRAVNAARKAGFTWKKETVNLVPTDKLVKLVSKSRSIQAKEPQEES